MAQDVCDLDSRGIDGWTRLDEQQLAAANIDPEMLEDPESGFRAAIYTDGDGRYVLAFAGTDPKGIRDWIANFGQGLGLDTEQYAQAEKLSPRAHLAFGDDLVVTGHSLGGGLAATAALATDSAAVTFNAAGLHGDTMREIGLTPDGARALAESGLVRNYVVDGDALTYVQEESRELAPFAPDAVGHKVELADPHSFWEHLHPLNLWEPSHRVRLHLMDAVLEAMQKDRPWQGRASAA
ncbi:MAG: Mbeg1-like protein [Thermoanaerobaculia bacterium]